MIGKYSQKKKEQNCELALHVVHDMSSYELFNVFFLCMKDDWNHKRRKI